MTVCFSHNVKSDTGGAVAGIQPDPSLGDVPGTDDVLSLAASANLFSEGVTGEEASNTFGEASRSSAQSSGYSVEGNPIWAVIRTALARCSSGRLGSA
ncbi:unnamed protein product [Gadus morhua 'NCC']